MNFGPLPVNKIMINWLISNLVTVMITKIPVNMQNFILLFPMLKYCILIGCSLSPKSDIMQDDVNCPISLS